MWTPPLRMSVPAQFSLLPWVSGRWYQPTLQGDVGPMSFASSRDLYFGQIYVPNPAGVTITTIGLEVTTLLANSTIRCGLYTDDNGDPLDLLVDSGALSGASTGFKSTAISQFLPQGWYWLAACGSSLVTLAVRSVTGNVQMGHSLEFKSNAGPGRVLETTSWSGTTTLAQDGLPKRIPKITGGSLQGAGGWLGAGGVPRVLVSF